MLTQLEATVLGVTAPDFSTSEGSAASDPIQIRNIDGLGPVAGTVNMSQYAAIEGGYYNGITIGGRNIVLSLGLKPNWSDLRFEDLRMILYQYFMPGNKVKLYFTSTHMPKVMIEGYVETCEPNEFSKDPEFQVSIQCPSPFFKAVDQSALTGTTVALGSQVTTDITYEGNVPCGYVTDVTFVTGSPAVTNGEIRVVNNTPSVQLWSATSVTVDSTHFLRMSTLRGNKYAQQGLLPVGTPSSIMEKVSPASIWSMLEPGVNKFQVMSTTPGQSWALSYNALFGGI